MKYLLLLAFGFLCYLLKTSVCDGSARKRQTPTIPWSTYCGCLQMDTSDESALNTCFRNFFKGQAVKQIMRKHRSNREACFRPNKDGDQECKVCDFSQFIKSLVIHKILEVISLRSGNLGTKNYIFCSRLPAKTAIKGQQRNFFTCNVTFMLTCNNKSCELGVNLRCLPKVLEKLK